MNPALLNKISKKNKICPKVVKDQEPIFEIKKYYTCSKNHKLKELDSNTIPKFYLNEFGMGGSIACDVCGQFVKSINPKYFHCNTCLIDICFKCQSKIKPSIEETVLNTNKLKKTMSSLENSTLNELKLKLENSISDSNK